MNRPARILACAYELGEHSELASDLEELNQTPQLRDFLLGEDGGFHTIRSTDGSVLELMTAAAEKVLASTGVIPEEIDAVLLATDSLARTRSAHDEVRTLATELHLPVATPSTVGLLDCAAPVVAIATAAAMVEKGIYRNALVISGDVAEIAAEGTRIVAGGSAVASDAGAAVLIGTEGPGRTVLGAAFDYSPDLINEDLPPHQQLRLRIAAQRRLHGQLKKTTGAWWRRPDMVLPSNLARRLLITYLDDVGYREDALFLENIATHGHCLGSDPLINLVDLQTAHPDEGATCLLMGLGVAHSAALLLGSVDDQD
ncbi:hypothetical protein [Rhodococcus tibetensis]|uniref:Beta-ketoacyl-[acyl-carrier-protein] synthase III N-terminal domain-containing protein n=1 Tax=Rhodococcus tibetensis TaxID=2965064 RepID=A0ABT1QMP3_9NOCA|nr:hypothetical protein [Rhodococcus sp. FXJ9.536]MCQ4122367.1 hypothetical protein [Rhodococcus sp. FXJ9.536]